MQRVRSYLEDGISFEIRVSFRNDELIRELHQGAAVHGYSIPMPDLEAGRKLKSILSDATSGLVVEAVNTVGSSMPACALSTLDDWIPIIGQLTTYAFCFAPAQTAALGAAGAVSGALLYGSPGVVKLFVEQDDTILYQITA
jgi:hypothetical protein